MYVESICSPNSNKFIREKYIERKTLKILLRKVFLLTTKLRATGEREKEEWNEMTRREKKKREQGEEHIYNVWEI